jgi:LmbE family N-acetylglucosaminyl deacetylase
MDTVPLLEVIQSVEAFLEEMPAATVYTHHFGDLNIDHRIAGEAVLTACRPLPGSPARKIYCGETLSSTEWTKGSERFAPTTFFDVARFIDRKIEALACYEAELRNFPHPRSAAAVRALAAIRGAESGLEAAEAFALIRHVQR